MRRQPVSFYTVKANHITNKISGVEHTTYKNNYVVVHITEAGLGKQLPDTLNNNERYERTHKRKCKAIHQSPSSNPQKTSWNGRKMVK